MQESERYISTIFFVDPAKVLRLWELGWGYPLFVQQNIDSMGVAGKILRNKELEGRISSFVVDAELVSDWWQLGRTLPLSAS